MFETLKKRRSGVYRSVPVPHGFGVAAVSAGTLLNLVQKWLGHAQLSATAICADAAGTEERDIVRRMWA